MFFVSLCIFSEEDSHLSQVKHCSFFCELAKVDSHSPRMGFSVLLVMQFVPGLPLPLLCESFFGGVTFWERGSKGPSL